MSANPPVSKVLNDPARLAALQTTALLDSPPEAAFDRLTRLARHLLEAPVVLVSLVDKDRQFFKSQVGLAEPLATERQTPLSHSFCQHVVATAAPLIVADARKHPILQHNLAVKDRGVIAYLGVPLKTVQGQTLGSLCTIDAKPRDWSAEEATILQDIGELVMTEIELRLLARQFQANYLELRNLELQRQEVAQMLVHDLRNPLSSLLMGLELAEMTGGLDTEQKACLAIAREGGQTLLEMINQILDVSKAEAGQLGLDLAEVAPRTVIDDAVRQIAHLAENAEVAVTLDVPSSLPLIKADAGKLRRVLVNLMSNGIQHTPKQGQVRMSARRSEDGRGVMFEVADTGSGMPSEDFDKIFEKFGRAKSRRLGKISTGLGLPFCKMVVEAHGGQISLQSELGRGTTFGFWIPCVKE